MMTMVYNLPEGIVVALLPERIGVHKCKEEDTI